MARLSPENTQRARDVIALYPQPRSALIPVLHIAQEQDGYLTPEAMTHVGELIGLTAAEVRGTATFYDMLHTEPVGRYVLAICTNIACLLNGAYELLEHAEHSLGVKAGATTADGMFTVEEFECLALCGNAPCLTANWRFFGDLTPSKFDGLISDLRMGRLDAEVPPHGTLCRVRRSVGLVAADAPGTTSGPAPAAPPAPPPPATESRPAETRLSPGPPGPRPSVPTPGQPGQPQVAAGSDATSSGPAPEEPAPPASRPHGSDAPADSGAANEAATADREPATAANEPTNATVEPEGPSKP
jgi:NADH-quinone oxidoreductase E subunit